MSTSAQYRAIRGRASEKGSAMVEYAFVLSIFILLCYAFIQFCLILFGFNNATYASRMAMRYAVVHGSTSGNPCNSTTIQSMVTPLLWGAPSGGATVTTTFSPDNSPGSTVSIKVTISYSPKIPFFPNKTFTVGTTAYGTILQ